MTTTTVGQQEVALIDLIDRLLGGGVVVYGDVTLAVAEVDLVYVSLRALISSVASAQEKGLLPTMGDTLKKDALKTDVLKTDAL